MQYIDIENGIDIFNIFIIITSTVGLYVLSAGLIFYSILLLCLHTHTLAVYRHAHIIEVFCSQTIVTTVPYTRLL